MGKKADIAETKVAQIVVLREEGLTQREIAARVGISQSSVNKCLARYVETGSYSAKKRPARKRVTTARDDASIRRMVIANPSVSSSEIASSLPDGVSPSLRTIRRRLLHSGLKSYSAATKPLLSAKNVKDRLAFCHRYKTWTKQDWHKVMFSDESTVKQFYSYQTRVRRPRGQRYNSRYTIATTKHPKSIMFWGAIAARGRCGLWIMPPGTTINAAVYLSILKEKLPIFMALRNCSVFLQDSAPCHTARSVKQWLSINDITMLEYWPGSSPDLNPIEHCWTMVKRQVSKLRPTSEMDPISKLKQAWVNETTPDHCRTLVESMPSRINEALPAKGGPTRY